MCLVFVLAPLLCGGVVKGFHNLPIAPSLSPKYNYFLVGKHEYFALQSAAPSTLHDIDVPIFHLRRFRLPEGMRYRRIKAVSKTPVILCQSVLLQVGV